MKTIIANPLYDAVFKFLMEDELSAKALLSALLKKKVVSLQSHNTEYNDVLANQVAIYRLDFAAEVEYYKNPDDEQLTREKVLIEVQKAKATYEVFRFRRYVGNSYFEDYSIADDDTYGYHPAMVTIYILGHNLSDLEEPVTYIRRGYFDYYDNPIKVGVPHPFVESLTHDSIVCQVPRLKDKHRNKVEQIMSIFKQENLSANKHERTIDMPEENNPDYEDIDVIINRLQMAAVDPITRHKMEIEDVFVRELATKDNLLAKQEEKIGQQEEKIGQQAEKIGQQVVQLAAQEEKIGQQAEKIGQQAETISASIKLLKSLGLSDEEIAEKLGISKSMI